MDTPVYRRGSTLRLPGEGPVYTLDYHPSGTEFAVGQRDAIHPEGEQHITRCRAADAHLLGTLKATSAPFWLRYSQDGRWLVGKCSAYHLIIYDLVGGSQYDWKQYDDPRLARKFQAYSFLDADRLLLPGSPTQVWALAEQRLIWEVATDPDLARPFGAAAAAAREDGAQVALYGVSADAVTLHDGLTGLQTGVLPDCPSGVMHMAYVGHYLVVQATKMLRLYDTRSLSVVRAGRFAQAYGEGIYFSIRAHPTQPMIAVGTPNGWLHLLNVPEGEDLMIEQIHHSRIYDLAFATDGQRLLVPCEAEARIDVLERT